MSDPLTAGSFIRCKKYFLFLGCTDKLPLRCKYMQHATQLYCKYGYSRENCRKMCKLCRAAEKDEEGSGLPSGPPRTERGDGSGMPSWPQTRRVVQEGSGDNMMAMMDVSHQIHVKT